VASLHARRRELPGVMPREFPRALPTRHSPPPPSSAHLMLSLARLHVRLASLLQMTRQRFVANNRAVEGLATVTEACLGQIYDEVSARNSCRFVSVAGAACRHEPSVVP
jgi:hypothetical protein